MAFGAGQTEGKCAGFERVALDLQRDQYIQNLASGFQPLDWDGREEFAGRAGGCGLTRVGCKGESAPRTTANPFFYFYFILSASFRRQLENKNSKSCVLSTAGNHEGKKKTQEAFLEKNPRGSPGPSTNRLTLNSGAEKSGPHWWNEIEICLYMHVLYSFFVFKYITLAVVQTGTNGQRLDSMIMEIFLKLNDSVT